MLESSSCIVCYSLVCSYGVARVRECRKNIQLVRDVPENSALSRVDGSCIFTTTSPGFLTHKIATGSGFFAIHHGKCGCTNDCTFGKTERHEVPLQSPETKRIAVHPGVRSLFWSSPKLQYLHVYPTPRRCSLLSLNVQTQNQAIRRMQGRGFRPITVIKFQNL